MESTGSPCRVSASAEAEWRMRNGTSENNETRLAALFRSAAAAIEAGRYPLAERLADSARRFAPADATAVRLHSRLLLKLGAIRAAGELLLGREEPESVVLRAEAALAAGSPELAQQLCESLLSRFAVDTVEHLARMASDLCACDLDRFPGWVGVDSGLRLVGAIRRDRIATLECDGRKLASITTGAGFAPLADFSVSLPSGCAGVVRLAVEGTALLGSPQSWPPDCRAGGWVVWDTATLSGEVSLGWAPSSGVWILCSHHRSESTFEVKPTQRGDVGWTFAIPFEQLSSDEALEVFALSPDGRRTPLSGSPLKMSKGCISQHETRTRGHALSAPIPEATVSPKVNIVIPVYSGTSETLACLRSVLSTTDPELASITVVDDASPEHALIESLVALGQAGRITLLRNPRNLGFPGAANRGMRAHPDKDVVLLNSDTEVFGGWLERLRGVAYSSDDIGTVTPFGEASAITTYADLENRPYSPLQAAEIDRIAHSVNGQHAIEIPVGVGFCLYIRRRCLEDTGELEEEAFGKGYGEESDFCLRARRLGWRHMAATGMFVRHAGARSYGPTKQVLTARNSRVINQRHPGYDRLIAEFLATDPLLQFRRAIDRQRLLTTAANPVLLVSSDLPGGVERHVEHRREVLGGNHTVLVLRGASSSNGQHRVRLSVPGSDFAHLSYELPQDLSEMKTLFLDLGLRHVEIHHFLDIPGAVLEMVASLGVPYSVFVHDYAWICPRVALLNGAGTYCGEPPIEACEVCVRDNGSALREPMTARALRARSLKIMSGAARIVVPTLDVHNRLERYFPGVSIEVLPWEQPGSKRLRLPRPHRDTVRVALIGAIGTPKGYAVLLSCARDAAARNLPLEFVVIGYTRDDTPLLETGRVFVTGPYKESEATALLRREKCDIAFFPCQAPETWCYTLSYALAENLPIVAIDLGAVAERLRASGAGALLPLATAPTMINDTILSTFKAANSNNPFAGNRGDPMQSNHPPANGQNQQELTAAVQVIALPVGIYAFTVTDGGTPDQDGLALPALLVAPAPVRSAGVIEFLEGPATVGHWLTRTGDVVMVKISQQSASLLLTSLRAPDSSVLSIDIRKLDVQATPTAAANGALPPNGEIDVPSARTFVHVRNVGDLEFSQGWAGRADDKLWIEAFAVIAQKPSKAELLEYSAVDNQGTELGWLSGGALCGTRGQGTPLTAFAVRVNPAEAAEYSCAYTGRFLSGAVVGPLRDGTLCRSESPDDPLVAIEVQLDRNSADRGSTVK